MFFSLHPAQARPKSNSRSYVSAALGRRAGAAKEVSSARLEGRAGPRRGGVRSSPATRALLELFPRRGAGREQKGNPGPRCAAPAGR